MELYTLQTAKVIAPHIEAGPAVKTTVTRLDFASFDQILEGYN